MSLFIQGRIWPVINRVARKSPLRLTLYSVRFLSSSNYDDEKLRQIIETSNVGMAQKLKEVQTKISDAKSKTPRHEDIKKTSSASKIVDPVPTKSVEPAKVNFNVQAQPESPIVKALLKRLVDLRDTLSIVSKTLNEVTGYSAMEKLKLLVGDLENQLKEAKTSLKTAKVEYAEAIQRRSDLQKEINELLTRKHNWSPADVERFTELYKNDHTNQQQEQAAEKRLEAADQNVDIIQNLLTQLILTRYHEEQMWSDKIRQVLTWGTWLLTGVNVLLFIVSAFFVEPWKRRRLVDAFQKEMQVKVDEFSADIKSISQQISVITGSQIKPTKEDAEELHAKGNPFHLKFTNIRTWEDVKNWTYAATEVFKKPQVGAYLIDRLDFAVFSGVLLALGFSLGSALSYLFISR